MESSSSAPSVGPVKRKSDDIAWEWGECRDPGDLNAVTCTLCGKIVKGGIYRLKEHLIHKVGNVRGCTSVPIEVQRKVQEAMNEARKKKVEKERVNYLIRNHDVLNELQEDELDEIEAIESIGSGVSSGSNVRVPVQGQARGKKRVRSSNVRGPMDNLLKTDAKATQTLLDKNNPIIQKLKDEAWNKYAIWAFQSGISFYAVTRPSFQDFFDAVGEYGRACPAPTYHHIRTTLLNNLVTDTRKFVDEFRVHWKMYGCSIMSDGWTDGKGRSLINFLVNCPQGTVFLKSIDASDHIKDANFIAELVNEVISDVGAENIIQFITDNGSNYKAARKILMEQHPNMFWTPCATHCINLTLQDLGEKLPKIKSALSDSRAIIVYIYNHGLVLSMMRKLTGRELHRSCETRFATNFYTLKSINENKSHLQVLFVSEAWTNSRFAKTIEGKRVARIVGREDFWKNVFFACQVLAPLVDVLRIVDTELKPSIGYIYEAMTRAKKQIQKNLEKDYDARSVVCEIINGRWADQLHHPLHAAAYYLNPAFYYNESYSKADDDEELMNGFWKAVQKLIPDEDMEKFYGDWLHYKNASSTLGHPIAVRFRGKHAPGEWWHSHGQGVPTLQKFAIRVLSQTSSASPCERNWSAFDHVHSKKRNCLLQEKLNDIVFFQYNRKLRDRFLERKNRSDDKAYDPLFLQEVEENDEWVIPTDEELVDFNTQVDEDEAWLLDREQGPMTRSRTQMRSRTDVRPNLRLVDEEEEIE